MYIMSWMVKFQRYFFLSVAFLLGSVAPLYGNVFNFLLLIFVLLLWWKNGKQVWTNLMSERLYIGVNVAFLLYFSLHTIIVLLKGNPIAKPSYGTFEALALNFVLVPIFVVTWKDWLTPALVKRFLFYFCVGSLLLNLYILLMITGTRLFTAPGEALGMLYDNRFGENRVVLGSKYWLEVQAMLLAISALITYFLTIIEKRWNRKVCTICMFWIFVLFLSFTVTKSAIFGFLLGFLVMNIYLFKKFSFWRRIWVFGGTLLVVLTFVLLSDLKKYEERIEEMEVEMRNVRDGQFVGGTLAPRLAFIKESFKHSDEFSLWGLGVMTKHRIKAWYEASDLNIAQFNNVNNAFLQYWITGGIVGLAVVLFVFFASIYRMIKRKRFSFLILAIICVFLVVSNSCVTLSWANSRALMLIFFAMFYFYGDIFFQLENDISRDKSSSI
jgi:membrane protein